MKNQDPVLDVLEKLASKTPDALLPLIAAYRSKGIDGLDDAWKQILKDAIGEN
ncbi:MAG TPA: hypothetical protein VN778_03145 [Verrucomicrobiae bacterium]|nr:hypothetical protein [Verrucomicrobiae bacterium]